MRSARTFHHTPLLGEWNQNAQTRRNFSSDIQRVSGPGREASRCERQHRCQHPTWSLPRLFPGLTESKFVCLESLGRPKTDHRVSNKTGTLAEPAARANRIHLCFGKIILGAMWKTKYRKYSLTRKEFNVYYNDSNATRPGSSPELKQPEERKNTHERNVQ